MNLSPWLAGASTIGRPERPSLQLRPCLHAGPVGGPLRSVPVLASRWPSKESPPPARSWMGDFRKTAFLPCGHRLPTGPALADLCPLHLPLAVCTARRSSRAVPTGRGLGCSPPLEDLPCCAGHGDGALGL